MPRYNLLRSKTFWTMVVMFLFNGFQAISDKLPGNSVLIVNVLLTGLAAVFHQMTGSSITGSN